LITISRKSIQELEPDNGALSNFYQIFTDLRLKLFSNDDMDLYWKRIENLGLNVSADYKTSADEYCGSHPYLLDVLNHEVFNKINQTDIDLKDTFLEIIDDLRFKQFVKKPKWIIGYSDITVLHSHIYSNFYISTLHSPMAAAFNDGGNINEYVLSLKDALEGKPEFFQNPVTNFCRKGDEEGELVGGNLAMLAHMVGTGSDIKTKSRILFIEDVGEYQYNIDRMMRQLKRAGKLEKLNGLIFGIFSDTKDTERPFGTLLHEMLWEIIKEYDYPVCFDFPISHTDKNYALKTGVRHRLKVGEKKITLEELS